MSRYGRTKSTCEWRRWAKRGNAKKHGAAAVGPDYRQMRTAHTQGHVTNFSEHYTWLNHRVVSTCRVSVMPGLALPASLKAVLDAWLSLALGKTELSTPGGWDSVYTVATTFYKSFLFSVLFLVSLSCGTVSHGGEQNVHFILKLPLFWMCLSHLYLSASPKTRGAVLPGAENHLLVPPPPHW